MPRKLRIALLAGGALLIAVASFSATYYYISSNEKKVEQKRLTRLECGLFYQKQRLPNWETVQPGDNWEKHGKFVVELNAHTGADSYIRRLCVVDKIKGTISIPGIRNEGTWER